MQKEGLEPAQLIGKERPLLTFDLPSVLTSLYLLIEPVNWIPGVGGFFIFIYIYMFSYFTSGFHLQFTCKVKRQYPELEGHKASSGALPVTYSTLLA